MAADGSVGIISKNDLSDSVTEQKENAGRISLHDISVTKTPASSWKLRLGVAK